MGENSRRFTCWDQPRKFYCDGCPREPRLTCTLELLEELKLGKSVPIKISIKNESSSAIRVDPMLTPLAVGALDESTFHVHCDGNDEPWTSATQRSGPASLRADPSRYLEIPAGGAIEREHDLRQYFEWMRGACMVHWSGMLFDVIDGTSEEKADRHPRRVVVDCNWATTRIEP